MKYVYSATIIADDTGSKYYCRIPDLPSCITTGESLDDAIDMITDAASGWLVVAEDEGLDIPKATPQYELKIEKGAICSLIRIDTIQYRAQTDTRSVRKNVSLPAWMNSLAEKRGINCSKVLQEALSKIFNSPVVG